MMVFLGRVVVFIHRAAGWASAAAAKQVSLALVLLQFVIKVGLSSRYSLFHQAYRKCCNQAVSTRCHSSFFVQDQGWR